MDVKQHAHQRGSVSVPWGWWVLLAGVAAILVSVGSAAFLLSYSALTGLATSARVPREWSGLLPAVIDGTILVATFGMLLTTGPDRSFFLRLLASGLLVSVAGNSVHASLDGQTLPWWAAALVAAIPPVSVFADTHGLAVLYRVAQGSIQPAVVVESVTATEPPMVTEPSVGKPTVSAKERKRPVRRDPGTVRRAVEMREQGMPYPDIAKALDISVRTARNYAPKAPAPTVQKPRNAAASTTETSKAVPAVRPPVRVQPMLPVAVPVGGA